MYTDVVIDKLRCSVQRLQKTIKPKSPKDTPKKVGESKQAAKDVKTVLNGTVSEEIQNKTNGKTEISKLANDANPQDAIMEKKTPRKVVRRKSVYPDDNKVTSSPQVKTNVLSAIKTPETESVGGSESPDATNKADVSKFKKIKDIESSPVKKTPEKIAKRKPELIEDAVSPDATEDDGDENNPKKRLKTSSLSFMDITIDEQDLDVTNTETSSLHKDGKRKILNCVICGKSFNKKTDLRDHIDACHMGERLKECPHCSMEFRSQQKYESHVFNEKCKNALHICQYPKCNKRFKTVHKMEMHMQDKHSSQNDTDSDN